LAKFVNSLKTREKNKKVHFRSMIVVFGPKKGTFWARCGPLYRESHGLPEALQEEISDKSKMDSRVLHVTLGYGDSWVAIFDNNDIEFSLKGYYGSLEKTLKEAKNGSVKVRLAIRNSFRPQGLTPFF
jgi:hypothetical protein